jgi:hypothetical protein
MLKNVIVSKRPSKLEFMFLSRLFILVQSLLVRLEPTKVWSIRYIFHSSRLQPYSLILDQDGRGLLGTKIS